MKVSEFIFAQYVANLQSERRRRGIIGWIVDRAQYIVRRINRAFTDRQVLAQTTRYTASLSERATTITQRMLDGRIGLPDWQVRMAELIRESWLTNAVAGRGGRDAMSSQDWGRTGGRLSFELSRLDNFANQIYLGRLSPDQILWRIQLYFQASTTAFYDGLTSAKAEAGMTEERRIMTPAEHCEDCMNYEAMGWQPIGSLPEPGEDSACMRNCKCYKEYR